MTKEEVLKVLKDSFKDFIFFEDGHYYTCKNKPVGVSVTRFIAEYENEFNQQEVAEKVVEKNKKNYEYAKNQLKLYNPLELNYDGCFEKYKELQDMLKQPLTIEKVLKEWKYKADFACAKGSTCHEYAQSLWSKEQWIPTGIIRSGEFITAVEKIRIQANNFYQDYKDRLEHLFDELPIGSEEYDIASCVDHLFYNKLTGEVVLVDYKTNSYMSGYNKKAYSKKMKVPLNHLNDDALHHYYIQLSIYKYLIETYTPLKIGEMFIVYMSENIENYEIIETPYLEKEVKKILENRRVKITKKLYKLPEKSKLYIGDEVVIFGHTDGLYSYCWLENDKKKIVHIKATTMFKKYKDGYKYQEEKNEE